ncbi:MAG: hypothetical protein R2865_16540 [Deinococcales bacterium]
MRLRGARAPLGTQDSTLLHASDSDKDLDNVSHTEDSDELVETDVSLNSKSYRQQAVSIYQTYTTTFKALKWLRPSLLKKSLKSICADTQALEALLTSFAYGKPTRTASSTPFLNC